MPYTTKPVLISELNFDEYLYRSIIKYFKEYADGTVDLTTLYDTHRAFSDDAIIKNILNTKKGIISIELSQIEGAWDKVNDSSYYDQDNYLKYIYSAYWYSTILNIRLLTNSYDRKNKINGIKDLLQLKGKMRKILSSNSSFPIKDFTIEGYPVDTTMLVQWEYSNREKPVTFNNIPQPEYNLQQLVIEIPIWVKVQKAVTGEIIIDKTFEYELALS